MNDFFNIPKEYSYHLVIAGVLSIFSLVFCVIYNPFNIQSLFASVGNLPYFFHILMISVTILISSCLSRLILWALLTKYDWQSWQYFVFCFCELTLIASFIALYSSLFLKLKFLEILPECEMFTLLVLIFPYLISIILRISNTRLKALNTKPENQTIVKFYDSNKKMRLAIDPTSLLFIRADANYININYLENSQNKIYLLRNSMKNINDTATKCGLVRCHRSYFINPQHIKALSRNKDGLFTAELKIEGLEPIPVSKMYYEVLLEKI